MEMNIQDEFVQSFILIHILESESIVIEDSDVLCLQLEMNNWPSWPMITPVGDRASATTGIPPLLVPPHPGWVIITSGHLIHCCPQSLKLSYRLHSTLSHDLLSKHLLNLQNTPNRTMHR